MQWYEVLIIILAFAFVVFVFINSIIKRKKGKGCCDCSACGLDCSYKNSKK